MTDITALARKADHPFDEVAVEAGKAAFYATHNHKEDAFENFLTAACKSMKDRGMAREGVATEKRGVWLARSQDHPGSNCMFVTIIRHKENGDG